MITNLITNIMKYVFPVLAVMALVLASASFLKPTEVVREPYGAVPGGDFTNKVNFMGGVMNSGLVASTSQGASITVTAAEFRQWADAAVVSFRQGLLADTTLTFPASSSVPSLVPKAGDRQTFCIRNATSTAALNVTLAGSTGINLLVASSSATALGSKNLATGKVGCITLVRQPATATTFDIDALLTIFN